MKARDQQRRAQDLPAILECYAVAKMARRRRWRRRWGLARRIAFWLVFLAVGGLGGLVIAAAWDAARQEAGGQECGPPNERRAGVRTDPAGRHLPAFGQKDCGPTSGRGKPTRAAESGRILPAKPPVQSAVTAPHSALRVSHLLAAIRQVESSGRADPPDRDGGRSIGPYQIQRDYWTDARVAWPYEAVRGEREARLTVQAYWRRRAPEALATGDLQVLARLHNGGPNWAAKPSTLDYWRRVLAALPAGRRGNT